MDRTVCKSLMRGISRIAVFKKIKKVQIVAVKIGRSYAVLEKDLKERSTSEQ